MQEWESSVFGQISFFSPKMPIFTNLLHDTYMQMQKKLKFRYVRQGQSTFQSCLTFLLIMYSHSSNVKKHTFMLKFSIIVPVLQRVYVVFDRQFDPHSVEICTIHVNVYLTSRLFFHNLVANFTPFTFKTLLLLSLQENKEIYHRHPSI